MYKKILLLLSPLVCLLSPRGMAQNASWQFDDNYIYTTIASHHFSMNTTANVHYILKNSHIEAFDDYEKIVWEHKFGDSTYKHTLTVKPGLSYPKFCMWVQKSKKYNLYKYLLACVDSLKKRNTGEEADYWKYVKLKALVHLVGDAHQPAMIRIIKDNAADSLTAAGRKNSQYNFLDSIALRRPNVDVLEKVVAYDTADSLEIRKLQGDSILTWLYESYKIRQKIDKELKKHARPDSFFLRDYQMTNQRRIMQAGVRLAGLLNQLYGNETRDDPYDEKDFVLETMVFDRDLSKIYGNTVTLMGTIVSYVKSPLQVVLKFKYFHNREPITIILKGSAMQLRDDMYTSDIYITGKIVNINGQPAMEITKANRIAKHEIIE